MTAERTGLDLLPDDMVEIEQWCMLDAEVGDLQLRWSDSRAKGDPDG